MFDWRTTGAVVAFLVIGLVGASYLTHTGGYFAYASQHMSNHMVEGDTGDAEFGPGMMMEENEQMLKRLEENLEQMEAAEGQDKIEPMAKIVKELVKRQKRMHQQRQQMFEYMEEMPGRQNMKNWQMPMHNRMYDHMHQNNGNRDRRRRHQD